MRQCATARVSHIIPQSICVEDFIIMAASAPLFSLELPFLPFPLEFLFSRFRFALLRTKKMSKITLLNGSISYYTPRLASYGMAKIVVASRGTAIAECIPFTILDMQPTWTIYNLKERKLYIKLIVHAGCSLKTSEMMWKKLY
jgi:hypothetical protein